MTMKLVRAMFVIACIITGVLWGMYLLDDYVEGPVSQAQQRVWMLLWGGGGAIIGLLVLLGLRFITQELFERMFPAFIAIALAMMLGYFLARYLILILAPEDVMVHVLLTTTLVLVFGYAGIMLGLTRASNWESLISEMKKRHIEFGNPKVVDTSVIIDGRIADILHSGFIEGTLIIPRFVLKELQNIADSSDVLRRAKGRRGLDIIKAMQEETDVSVEIVEEDYPDTHEVDGKLVRLARTFKAKILTNDFNLNKVAQIEGVQVLNINDLANALKPAVLPDEQMEVKIIKEGKEASQGVGYLDDGTMVVVDGGRDHVGKHVSVIVTSVLQTAAGRMIFTKLSNVLT
jgi:uncharacterized protein YacL